MGEVGTPMAGVLLISFYAGFRDPLGEETKGREGSRKTSCLLILEEEEAGNGISLGLAGSKSPYYHPAPVLALGPTSPLPLSPREQELFGDSVSQ